MQYILRRLVIMVSLLSFTVRIANAEVLFVDSVAIKERFKTITAKDMELIRSKKILFASRSFGLNLRSGLLHLAKQDAKYDIMKSYERYDVFKAGGDLSIIPADIYSSKKFVHFLATYWPHTARIGEVEKILQEAPHEFAQQVDVVMIYYHTASLGVFEPYAMRMDALQEQYPHITFIYVTAGYMGPSQEKANKKSFEFNQAMREHYKGKVPLYDLGAILSDNGRCPQVFCPEYSDDPAGVHPNLVAGTEMMAKGFLLVLKEALTFKGSGVGMKKRRSSQVLANDTEILDPQSSEYKAVRAILDANNLRKKKVESVAVVEDGHVVGLYLQEGGVTQITDDIAALRHLKLLHVYGDRDLGLPLLIEISPKIAKCTRLEELLLNNNDLESLPKEITKLRKIQTLSVGDNKLKNVSGQVERWLKKYDPKGFELQN